MPTREGQERDRREEKAVAKTERKQSRYSLRFRKKQVVLDKV
jgi:hypothetical protein